MSLLVMPAAAISATRRSLAVSDSAPLSTARRGRAPVARSSVSARRAKGSAPAWCARCSASRSRLRASVRRFARRRTAPRSVSAARVLDRRTGALEGRDGLAREELAVATAGGRAGGPQGHAEGPRGPKGPREPELLLGEAIGGVGLSERQERPRGVGAPGHEGRRRHEHRLEDAAGPSEIRDGLVG